MNETLAGLAATPKRLEDLLNTINNAHKLDVPRAPGKWTPRQIFAHLADVETLQNIRIMDMLSKINPSMFAFSADDWADVGKYQHRDAKISVEQIVALRARNLELWSTLSTEQLQRIATHPTRGEFSVAQWLEFILKHENSHIVQLEQSL